MRSLPDPAAVESQLTERIADHQRLLRQAETAVQQAQAGLRGAQQAALEQNDRQARLQGNCRVGSRRCSCVKWRSPSPGPGR